MTPINNYELSKTKYYQAHILYTIVIINIHKQLKDNKNKKNMKLSIFNFINTLIHSKVNYKIIIQLINKINI